jgi:hypothetical protein
VQLLRPVTASLLLSTVLLASTARWAAADPLRKEWRRATQQKQINELNQREQLEYLKRAQELTQTQRQLDQLRQQEASHPGLAAQPRAQQLHETQKQLDQLKLEQQFNRMQHELQLNQIEREHNPLRRQEQIRELQLQQQIQSLQEQSRTKLLQQELNRSLLVDSGVLGFHAVHKSLLIYKAIEKEGLLGRDRDKSRIVRPRHVHDPGIQ